MTTIMNDPKVFILNNGVEIPAIGLGLWNIEKSLCKTVVGQALEVGYCHFDCAHWYGNDKAVGAVFSEAFQRGLPRSQVFITSKFWCATSSANHVESAISTSLQNLRLDYLDLFLVHWPDSRSSCGTIDVTDLPSGHKRHFEEDPINFKRRLQVLWGAMERVFQRNLVRAIGLSNFSRAHVEEILKFAKIVPAVHQMELHPFWRQDEFVKFCQSSGIHVSAHTPLGIPEKNTTKKEGPVLQRSTSIYRPMIKSDVVSEIATSLSRTPAQVLLRWGVQRGTSVLPRSILIERIVSNYDILDWSLSEDDWTKINSLDPQIQLVDGTHACVDHDQLQSVDEVDDSINNSSYEPKDELEYDEFDKEKEEEGVDEIEKSEESDIETKNDELLNLDSNLISPHNANNIVNDESHTKYNIIENTKDSS